MGVHHDLRRRLSRRLPTLVVLLVLVACGGGGGSGGGSSSDPLPPLGAGENAYDDTAAYGSPGGAALPGAVEGAAVTRHRLAGSRLAYTAHAGHLIARHPVSGAAQASLFHVSYLADVAAPATRPVTFFYNGGPGSASLWLHLGSFGPKRLATGMPASTAASPFPLVDNEETLLDRSDLVFVDAVGSGLSTAIVPFSNRSFWSVNADAALFRDFIVRWLAVFQRDSSPLLLYGESYGGPRTAVLARRLQEAGLMPSGLVLQSPAMDYANNCGVQGSGACDGHLPSYAAIAAWHGLASPAPPPIKQHMQALRGFTDDDYAPALAAWLTGSAVPDTLPPLLAGLTGLTASLWTTQFNLAPTTFQNQLLAGQLIGRYDGRVAAPLGSALAADGDPSSTVIVASFRDGLARYLRDTLRYTHRATYVLLGSAIEEWDFGHAGRALPDTVPDLAAALAADPALRVLAVSGYHDLATPFFVTERDLARLAEPTRVQVRNYPGGHMSYLDDKTRVRQRADLTTFYDSTLAAARAPSIRMRPPARGPAGADRTGAWQAAPLPVLAEPAVQTTLRDPWVPPSRR